MPQEHVAVVVVGEHPDERGPGGLVREPAERLRGEEPHARRAVREQREQRAAGRRVPHVADELRRLRGDLGIGVAEERQQRGGALAIRARELTEAPETVDAAQPVRRVARRDHERLRVAPARQLELRLEADPHVGVPQQRREVGRRARLEVLREQRRDLAPRRIGRRRSRIELPEPPGVLRSPPGDPVRQVERAVRPELHADGKDAAQDHRVAVEREPRAVLLQRERVDAGVGGRAGKAGHQEMIAPRLGQRRARVVDHARRPRVIGRDRRDDVRGLPVEARLEHRLVHPDVVAVVLVVGVLSVLPVGAPAAVGSFRDVDEPLGLARVVAVVVDADQIAELVEDELLEVPDPGREHLEAGAVEVRAQHGALIRIGPAPARLVHDVQADVADFPVETAIGTERHARDAVPAERRMNVVALADRHARIERAVAVGVAQPVDAGRHAQEEIGAVGEHAAGDVPHGVFVEPFGDDARIVGEAVAVGIPDPVDALLELGEIPKVTRSVLVEIGDPAVPRASLRRELAPVERAEILDGLEGVHGRHPVRVLPDVQRQVVPARARDVGRSALVEIDGHRIGQHPFGGPERELEPGRHLHRDSLPRVLRRRRRLGRRHMHGARLCRRGRLRRARQHRRDHDEAREYTPTANAAIR